MRTDLAASASDTSPGDSEYPIGSNGRTAHRAAKNQSRPMSALVCASRRTATGEIAPASRSKPTHDKQYHEDDQDDADDTNAAVTVAIAVAAEAATEATKQEDHEEDDEYESDRHYLSPVVAPKRTLSRSE